jgi:hypothetical protein
MKRTFALLGVLAVLSLSACSRKSACPAYGSTAKPQPVSAVRV